LERKLEIGRRIVTDASLKKARLSENLIFYSLNGVRWVRLPTAEERQAREDWRAQRRKKAVLKGWETRRQKMTA
jgi:hypothetical protein